MIYITGDTHGDMRRIVNFCKKNNLTREDVIIILGDAGINFYERDFPNGRARDNKKKEELAGLHTKIFCIHGNHEIRPQNIAGYAETTWRSGKVFVEYDYPNIMFAKDGEIFDFAGLKTIVIGGAYSVDKWYRLMNKIPWFEDEQPDEETKSYVERQLEKNGWRVDVVLSHTVPYMYRPTDTFIQGLDQNTVDTSTERWLQELEIKLDYKKWYAGHYHIERTVDNLQMMFGNIEEFGV